MIKPMAMAMDLPWIFHGHLRKLPSIRSGRQFVHAIVHKSNHPKDGILW
jgi:hypothetical protein